MRCLPELRTTSAQCLSTYCSRSRSALKLRIEYENSCNRVIASRVRMGTVRWPGLRGSRHSGQKRPSVAWNSLAPAGSPPTWWAPIAQLKPRRPALLREPSVRLDWPTPTGNGRSLHLRPRPPSGAPQYAPATRPGRRDPDAPASLLFDAARRFRETPAVALFDDRRTGSKFTQGMPLPPVISRPGCAGARWRYARPRDVVSLPEISGRRSGQRGQRSRSSVSTLAPRGLLG